MLCYVMKNFVRLLSVVMLLGFFSKVEALNVFEFALIGTGVWLAYNQYFDKSLLSENIYGNKVELLSKYDQSKQQNIKGSFFNNLPIQQQLKVIELIE